MIEEVNLYKLLRAGDYRPITLGMSGAVVYYLPRLGSYLKVAEGDDAAHLEKNVRWTG